MMPTPEQLLEARVMNVACQIAAITQRDQFYRGQLATSDDVDIFEVRDAVEADEEGLQTIHRFAEDLKELSDAETRTALQRLIEQLTGILQVSASGLRIKLDQAASAQRNGA